MDESKLYEHNLVLQPEELRGHLPRSQMPRTKRKKSVPREMSSRHKILNSDSESESDIGPTDPPILFRQPQERNLAPTLQNIPYTAPVENHLEPAAIDTAPIEVPAQEPVQKKRGRGRPRKHSKEENIIKPKRPRGRPRKDVVERIRLKPLCDQLKADLGDLVSRLPSEKTPEACRQLTKVTNLLEHISEHADEDDNLIAPELLESMATKQ